MRIFLFDKRLNLSDEARSRLQTIAEATELGAGFQMAMRDLEIRGAGEILARASRGILRQWVWTCMRGCWQARFKRRGRRWSRTHKNGKNGKNGGESRAADFECAFD